MSETHSTNSRDQNQLPKLFIGPWVGEFGIEILHWQGVVRAAARSRNWGEIVVSSWPDRKFLYEDFATRFEPYTPPTFHTCGASCRGYDESTRPWDDVFDEKRGDVWITPFGKPRNFLRIRALAASHSFFRNFSDGMPPPQDPFDLLIHARATNKHNQGHKNWPVSSWEKLVDSLPTTWRIASIGDRLGAHKIAGTADLRGVSLETLASHCGAARILIGPSSGPVHFAIHCGLPVVIWMGEHRHHYYPQWNPEGVPIVCFDTWQPGVDAVLARIRDLNLIVKVRTVPLRYLVVATKRSGHHAVIDWMTKLDPSRYQVWLNDCVSNKAWPHPHCSTAVPTTSLLPKQLGEPGPRDLVTESGNEKKPHERIISLEGASLCLIPTLPEAREAECIVFVLRDALNFAASYWRAFPGEFAKDGFLGGSLRMMLSTYREYLDEANGTTSVLGELSSKTVFVSYNRWHCEASYRQMIAERLGTELNDAPRGIVAAYGPRSAFQPETTRAEDLKTLERWREAIEDHELQAIWTACRDPELLEAERKFHGETIPLSRIEDAWTCPECVSHPGNHSMS